MSHIDITIKKTSALLHWSICLVGFRGVYEMCFPRPQSGTSSLMCETRLMLNRYDSQCRESALLYNFNLYAPIKCICEG